MSENPIRNQELRDEDDINDISKVNISIEDESQMALEIMEDNFLTKEDIDSPDQKEGEPKAKEKTVEKSP